MKFIYLEYLISKEKIKNLSNNAYLDDTVLCDHVEEETCYYIVREFENLHWIIRAWHRLVYWIGRTLI